MSTPQEAYDQLMTELREISLMGSIGGVLGWDEKTHMPPKGAEHRSKQASLLATINHKRFTSPQVGQWLSQIEGTPLVADPHSDPAVNVRETRRSYDRATKVPTSLVQEMVQTSIMGEQAWVESRKKSDFSMFAPWLTKTLELKRQKAACVAKPGQSAYDALLDDYEPNANSAELKQVFEGLRKELVELIGKIAASGRRAPAEILTRSYPVDLQEKLSLEVAKAVGFDMDAGRLDVSVHPFCTDLGPGDSRITTRYDANWFGDGFFGTLHETGHALYNQGLPAGHFGTPRGRAVSLGIHESQSRLWENLVGRGRPFWKFFYPKVKAIFAGTLADVSPDDWHFAINDISPSFIRTEADEATYNLHVLLRFELETALLDGDLPVADLPAAWNNKMQTYLGITPPNDAQGCLQDTHWAGGSIGYFPTYTLGNLYAAQFFEQAEIDLPSLDSDLSKGNFAPLLGWLRKNVHQHGKTYTAAELVQRISGRPLSATPLLNHLKTKAGELYGI